MIKQSITGTVYGVILNDAESLRRIGPLEGAPYKGAPKAPALYIKPANTYLGDGSAVLLPAGAQSVEVAATIGLVIGTSVARVSPAQAMAHVAGLVVAADLSLPHESYYRPAIREKCFDGALPLSSVKPLCDLGDLHLTTEIDGLLAEQRSLADLVRNPAQLLSDISEFMTLNQGDVVLVGVSYMAPQATVGSQIRISAAGIGSLHFSIAGAQA